MGGPCAILITRPDVGATQSAAMKTPAKCQMMKRVSAIRMTSAGRPPRRSRAGDAGFGFGAGGGADEPGVLIAAPTIVCVRTFQQTRTERQCMPGDKTAQRMQD